METLETLDEMIDKLKNLRESIGRNCNVFVSGWNDTGIVRPTNTVAIFVKRTGLKEDGEISRVWEESDDGDIAVIIS